MSGGRTRSRALWLAAESTFAADPSADGSGYLSVPADPLDDWSDDQQMLDTQFATGNEWSTKKEPGADGASLAFSLPLWGLQTAAGDGVNASTVADDVWDVILEHIFGVKTTTVGADVVSAGASALTFLTDLFNVESVLHVFESGLAVGRGQSAVVTVDGNDGSYTVSPNFVTTPTTAAVAYGAKIYSANSPFCGGSTLSCVYRDANIETVRLAGGRVTSFGITADVNDRLVARIEMRFTSVEDAASKSALPTILSATPITPMQLRWSPFSFDGTLYDTSKIEFGLGLETAPVLSSNEQNGRSGDENITANSMIKFSPLRAAALRNLKRAATEGRMLMQLGGGVLASGRVNTWSILFPAGQITEESKADDSGHARQDITVMANDAGTVQPVYIARF